ncbi:MAG TPA: hypothetical protein VGY99_18325 [Candidatus Binataceae bacterium]|jgi:hypothetical protein|nr:hypothetical protein [Candidatus Binataceae bacterium]
MATPLISEILPDFLEEIVYLLGQMGEGALGQQMRALRIESLCDCGDEQCASFATAAEVKVDRTVELQAMEGILLLDLNTENQICFIEILGRADVKYLLDDYNERKG